MRRGEIRGNKEMDRGKTNAADEVVPVDGEGELDGAAEAGGCYRHVEWSRNKVREACLLE